MCLFEVDVPDVAEVEEAPESPVSERSASPEMQAAVAEQKRRQSLSMGQMSTILTGPQGL